MNEQMPFALSLYIMFPPTIKKISLINISFFPFVLLLNFWFVHQQHEKNKNKNK
ncbi:Uncharacterized protein APZ42_027657 [Daphnia magna]|uniref:Uncharacterized protein n=1 Tax=Daphnia magna TaxID=35525 RepID=A0A164R5V7_9CRUS|nr:Uncharacterized protein APZ42_027657 [Daphnia magna]